jgi:hypothetical protein
MEDSATTRGAAHERAGIGVESGGDRQLPGSEAGELRECSRLLLA